MRAPAPELLRPLVVTVVPVETARALKPDHLEGEFATEVGE